MDGRQQGSEEKKKKRERRKRQRDMQEEEGGEVKVKEEEKEEETTSSLLLSNDMKDTITKTMPHPLWESSRREFKKLMTTKSQGTSGQEESSSSSLTMFGSIDKDIISIIQSLTSIVGTTYDSYTKAGKKILLSAPSSAPSNTDASLAKVVAEGNRAKEVRAHVRVSTIHLPLIVRTQRLANIENQYRLLEVQNEKQATLFDQLHQAASNVVKDGCSNKANLSQLQVILTKSKPLQRQQHPDFCSEKGVEDMVKAVGDISALLNDYKQMQTMILRLSDENRKLLRKGGKVSTSNIRK